jgi:hypothetical protein
MIRDAHRLRAAVINGDGLGMPLSYVAEIMIATKRATLLLTSNTFQFRTFISEFM